MGFVHFYPFVVMCDRSRAMGRNVFPPLLGSPYVNVRSDVRWERGARPAPPKSSRPHQLLRRTGARASCGSLIDAFSGSRARSGAQAGSQVEELLPRAAPQHPRHHRSYHQTAPIPRVDSAPRAGSFIWSRQCTPSKTSRRACRPSPRARNPCSRGPSSRRSTRPWPSFDSGSPPTLQSAPAATGEEQGWTCRK